MQAYNAKQQFTVPTAKKYALRKIRRALCYSVKLPI